MSASQPAPPANTPRPIDSASLFSGRREIEIIHNGVIYRLRQTAQGKRILTK